MFKKLTGIFYLILLVFICNRSVAQKSYLSKGKEFWISVMSSGAGIAPIVVYITSDVSTCGKIEIPLGTFSQNFSIAADSTLAITLPLGAAYVDINDYDSIVNKGVHIVANDSVLVYLSHAKTLSFDSELIYPISVLDTSYVVVSYHEPMGNAIFSSQFSIAATQNNTSVWITPSETILGGSLAFPPSRTKGVPFNLIMNAGQVYIGISKASLTGSTIKADKPIAVFAGATATYVGGCNAADHLCEQILPNNLYGLHYITAPYQSRAGGDMYRITAFDNATTLTINGGAPINMNASQWKDTILTTASEILSNKKIAVAQLARGQGCDGLVGDPFMILLHPVTEMNTKSLFYMANNSSFFTAKYVNVITATANTTNVFLNGVSIGASFTAVASNPLYSYAQVAVPWGANEITCAQGFLANAYAFGGFVSYGHVLGDISNTPNTSSQILTTCSGTSVTLSASPGSAYTWLPASNLNCSTCASVIANPTSTTNYTVSFISTAGCPDTLCFTVHVDSLPNASITHLSAVCLGASPFNLVAADTGGVWSGSGITNTLLGTFSPSLAGVGTHTVIYSINNGCVSSDTATINIISVADASVNSAGPFCENDPSLTLTAVAPGGVWSGPGIINTATGIFNPFNAGAGTHIITYSIGGVCGDTGSVLITVHALPTTSVTGPVSICKGDSVILTASGGGTYLWSNGSVDSIIRFLPSAAGSYSYSVSISNANCSAMDSFSFSVVAPPIVNAGPDDTICSGLTVNLTGSGSASYLWNTGATTSSILVSPLTDSTFMLIGYSGTCSDTDWVNLIVYNPTVVSAGMDVFINKGESVSLNPSGGGVYAWTPSEGLSCNNCVSPVASPDETTIYVVTVTNEYGCVVIDSVTVFVSENCSGNFFIPNAFSPNGDGQNDNLKAYGNCIKQMLFSVYNRWGEKVFETNNTIDAWDGSYKGVEMQTGIYVYNLYVQPESGEAIVKSGNISLIR